MIDRLQRLQITEVIVRISVQICIIYSTDCLFFCRVEVSPRKGCRKVEAIGIFPGATVVRGRDWSWGNQDGK